MEICIDRELSSECPSWRALFAEELFGSSPIVSAFMCVEDVDAVSTGNLRAEGRNSERV
jgi:hypothetical protein